MTNTYFIAGTDTDVGKTLASKALLQAFAQANLNTIGYKPVAAGSELTSEGRRNSDALHLQSAATMDITYDLVNPYALELPASPHIAIKPEQVTIDFKVLSNTLAQHQNQADVVIVEGAGGWRVPVSDTTYLSSWVQQEKLPVILIVGVKLGGLNHAVLTAEAIRHDGLEIAGWIANCVDPNVEHYSELITFLETQLKAPKLGEIPYLENAKQQDLAQYIQVDSLLSK